MPVDEGHPRLGRDGEPLRSRMSRWLFRAGVFAAGILVLIAALAISLALFAIALTVIAIGGAWFWWKTRHLRKEIRSALRGGEVIEGEVIQVDQSSESRPRTRTERP